MARRARVSLFPTQRAARGRPVRYMLLLALCSSACDDGAASTDGAAGAFELGVPDRRPAWDAGGEPDAPVPDVGRSGPPTLTIEPVSIVRVEGQPARAFSVVVHGELTEPVTVALEATVGTLSTAALVFGPGGPRSQPVELGAAFDADEDDERGTLRAAMPGGEIEAPVVVTDVHNTVELDFDEEQLAFVARSRDKERRLVAPIRINGRGAGAVELNLRGKGTLNCARRSFTVRFAEPTRVRDSPRLRHLLLLSMCIDSTYLKMRSSYELLAAQGLFPSWFSYAELRYGGVSRGVYLLVERPRKSIPRVYPSNEMIVRRIRDNVQEVKRPDAATIDDLEAFLAPYVRLYELRREFAGEALLTELRRHLDYDVYLRWLAINSVLMNGDYIDEVYFYDRPPPAGGVRPYFSVMAWDYDDVLRRCHPRGGGLPVPLLYCAESSLDRPVLDHPAIREVYVGILREVMAGLTPEAYEGLLVRNASELEPYLRRGGVVDAMRSDRDDGSAPPEPLASVAAMLELMGARYAALEELLP